MANAYDKQFLYSKYPKFTLRSGTISIGGSGTIASFGGPGVAAVSKLATGIYQIKLKDNFYQYVSSDFQMLAGTSGAVVGDGTFSANTLYQITTVGTTNWANVGFDSDYTPVVGAVFVASGTGNGGTFTGQAKAITPTTIDAIEVIQSPQKQLASLNSASGTSGASIFFQTLASTGPGTTTLVATAPVAGSQIVFNLWFQDSAVTVK